MTVLQFLEMVLFLIGRFNGSVTSWVRSASRNEAVGGVAGSRHLDGLAVDVVLDERQDGAEFKAACLRCGLKALDEGDHYHVQPLV